MPDFLNGYPLFAIISVVAIGLAHFLLWRHSAHNALTRWTWVLALLALGGGWFVAERAGGKEKSRLQEMLMGYAPTYATGMERIGHARLPSDAAPDDPLYLELINAQIRWLKANPTVNDIYTFRKTPTSRALIVDSETDYDHNGLIEGETEARTEIGEEYDEELPELDRALATGENIFNPEPVEDRWGIWVSAYAPIFAEDGTLDAVVGVDFDARSWAAAIKRAKGQVITLVALGLLLLVGATSVASQMLQKQEIRGREESLALKAVTDAKFETLVNAIQGIVFEWDTSVGCYRFVSSQVESVAGMDGERWRAGEWRDCTHPDDLEALLERRREAAVSGEPYGHEFRMTTEDGGIRWMRETGTATAGTDENSLRGILTDITLERQAATEMEALNKQLVEASRQAGMAEIASGVLHNIGNVLNSVNVAEEVIKGRLQQSRLPNLRRVVRLLCDQEPASLPEFFASERGRIIPDYLDKLTDELTTEQVELTEELSGLGRNVEHMKDIVMMQQSYAKIAGRLEQVDLRELISDALRINSGSFSNHNVKVCKEFGEASEVVVDRHKLLQILINLVRNAKHALDHREIEERILTVRLGENAEGGVEITVSDNGIGISEESFAKLFSHGFTTKRDGHGFGLHISAVAIKEMGGELTAHSEGPGKGASFKVTLPAAATGKRRNTADSNVPALLN